MFLKAIEITPTSALTFRKVPMSHTTIESYTFIPPTTLSGFLYRLLCLSTGIPLPKPKRFASSRPSLSDYYLLETREETASIRSLGGYTNRSQTFVSFRMGYQHLVKGHSIADGIDIFDPTEEEVTSLIRQELRKGTLKEGIRKEEDKQKLKIDKYYRRAVYKSVLSGQGASAYSTFKKEERRQPLNWQYLIADNFTGFLVSNEDKVLEQLEKIKNFGMKIGKEGFAFVSRIYKTEELKKYEGDFCSNTLVPTTSEDITFKQLNAVEIAYYFDVSSGEFKRESFAPNGTLVEGSYYEGSLNGNEPIRIPECLIKLLTEGKT